MQSKPGRVISTLHRIVRVPGGDRDTTARGIVLRGATRSQTIKECRVRDALRECLPPNASRRSTAGFYW